MAYGKKGGYKGDSPGVKSGLSERSDMSGDSLAELGMDSKGPNQKPIGVSSGSASKHGRNYSFNKSSR